jgi:hypothetical protein
MVFPLCTIHWTPLETCSFFPWDVVIFHQYSLALILLRFWFLVFDHSSVFYNTKDPL